MTKDANHPKGTFHPISAPDFLPLPQLRDLQLRRLQDMVRRAYDNVALFRKRLEERGITPEDVRTLEDAGELLEQQRRDDHLECTFGVEPEELARCSLGGQEAGDDHVGVKDDPQPCDRFCARTSRWASRAIDIACSSVRWPVIAHWRLRKPMPRD